MQAFQATLIATASAITTHVWLPVSPVSWNTLWNSGDMAWRTEAASALIPALIFFLVMAGLDSKLVRAAAPLWLIIGFRLTEPPPDKVLWRGVWPMDRKLWRTCLERQDAS